MALFGLGKKKEETKEGRKTDKEEGGEGVGVW